MPRSIGSGDDVVTSGIMGVTKGGELRVAVPTQGTGNLHGVKDAIINREGADSMRKSYVPAATSFV